MTTNRWTRSCALFVAAVTLAGAAPAFAEPRSAVTVAVGYGPAEADCLIGPALLTAFVIGGLAHRHPEYRPEPVRYVRETRVYVEPRHRRGWDRYDRDDRGDWGRGRDHGRHRGWDHYR